MSKPVHPGPADSLGSDQPEVLEQEALAHQVVGEGLFDLLRGSRVVQVSHMKAELWRHRKRPMKVLERPVAPPPRFLPPPTTLGFFDGQVPAASVFFLFLFLFTAEDGEVVLVISGGDWWEEP